MSTAEITRLVPVNLREDGCVVATTCLSPVGFKVRAEIQVPPTRVIPVIVVPGIMGSNLRKVRNHSVKVWAPPNGPAEAAVAAGAGTFSGPKARQEAFIPTDAEVDPSGPVRVPTEASWLNEDTARNQRGWGTVHLDSYGDLLSYLEVNLNKVFVNKKPRNEWASMHQQQDAKRWGAQKPEAFEPVTDEELKRLPRAFYPVYAAGYNWLKSNNEAAQSLTTLITEITAQWKKPYRCDQVILVTHSMGGLVARRCAQLIPDKILGVVHGVMPALGAAAAYKRMRAGFEGAAAAVLGWNEAEATAPIANAPGPLELLPQAAYNSGKPWLHVQVRPPRGAPRVTQSLPLKDPYKEIYEKDAKTCWYGLVNSELIDPAGLHQKPSPWDSYVENLKTARQFHQQLGDHYHPGTRAYYGADAAQPAWGGVTWATHAFEHQALPDLWQGKEPDATGTGKIDLKFGRIEASFKLDGPDVRGDGTVPGDASGHAPSLSPNVQQCYRMTGFDHQLSYNDPQARLAVLHSLVKLVQRSPLVAKA